MLTTDNDDCTWDLYKSIPSLKDKSKTVFEETIKFNEKHRARSMAGLVDRRRAKVCMPCGGCNVARAGLQLVERFHLSTGCLAAGTVRSH